MHFEVRRLVWIWALVAPTLTCGAGSAEVENRDGCNWSVSEPRVAGPKDVGYEELDPRLRDPENGNNVPGPDSLFAVVQSDKLHHPHIYIEDRSVGSRRELVGGSQPRWSPDGTRIACTVWESSKCFSALRIFDVRAGDMLSPDIPCHVVNYRWAPDGRSLAVAAVLPHSGKNALLWVHVQSGRARLLDTLTVFSDYEDLTWSPDSRALIATRVSTTGFEGIPMASDLWIFDSSGTRCQLTKTADVLESQPKWIDSKRVLYATRKPTELDLEESVQRVLEVQRARSGTKGE